MLGKTKHIHFVGIGGIGMSGMAELLYNLGFKISGSDAKISDRTKQLNSMGININIGHTSNEISKSDVVVFSSAVKKDNPEIIIANKHKIPVIRRAEMLSELLKVKSTSTKGILVTPENSDLEVMIKKSAIAINPEDARSNRFITGDRIDAAIAEISVEKRKIVLSIKLLEEMQNKEAVSKFSSPLSGKNLPFSSLSEKLDNKKKEDK